MVVTFHSIFRRIAAALVCAGLLVSACSPALAAVATPASDTLTRLKISVPANHEIRFKTPSGIDASSDAITVSMPDFIFGSVSIGDIDLSHGTSTGFEISDAIAASPSAGVWGASISGTTITFTAPTDAGVGTVSLNQFIGIRIGTNAVGGTNQLTNPSTSMSATVSVAGTFGDAVVMAVPIVDEDSVSVSATVAATSTPPTPPSGGGSGGGSGAQAPNIWNVQSTNITSFSAQITWNTDSNSTSRVDYGISMTYASGTVSDASYVSSHTINLTGLTPNTMYHFQVTSVDTIGLSATANDFTFITQGDVTPPVITNVHVTNITDTTALLLWDTDEPSTSHVDYGTSTSYGSAASNAGSVTSHSIQLNALTEGTLYHFFVTSIDGAGNAAQSSDATFTTTVDLTPPANSGSLTATPGDTQITLSWTNPPDADFLGTRVIRKLGSFPTGPFDGTFVYSGPANTVTDTGLVDGTTYFYGVYAYDAHGNFASGALVSSSPVGVTPPSPTSTPPVPPTTPPATSTPPVVPPPTTSPIVSPPSPVAPPSTPPGIPIPPSPPSEQVTPPSTGLGAPGQLLEYFYGNNGTVSLQPDSAGRIGVLVGSPVQVRVPVTGLGGIPSLATIRIGNALYSLQPTTDNTSYTGTFTIPTTGVVDGVVTVNFQNNTYVQGTVSFNVQPGGNIISQNLSENQAAGIGGATVRLYRTSNGSRVLYETATTNGSGSYAFVIPNGQYDVVVDADGYKSVASPVFTITQNVFNARVTLIQLPKIQPLQPQASVATNIGIIAGNIVAQSNFVLKQAQAVVQSPQVQTANNIAAPAVLALSVLNATSAVSFFNFLTYFQYFFTQPILLLGRRRMKKWGVVYNSLTKQPIDLAIVRLLQFETHLIVRTAVTDKFGRFSFRVKAGNYLLEVVKPGYVFPSQYLSGKTDDVDYPNLYNGKKIELKTNHEFPTQNIAMDPITSTETPQRVLWRKAFRNFQYAAAFSGIPVGMVILLITPSLPGALLILVQVGIFFLFVRLAAPTHAKSWGISFDTATRKPLNDVIVRIFDKKFNKLLETQVTDQNGKYGFLVRRNVYYVTAEKAGYKKFVSPDIDLENKDESLVDQNIALEKLP